MYNPWNRGIKYSEEQRERLKGIKKKIKRFGKDAPNWKGGKRKRTDGYIDIFNPKHPCANASNKTVKEHRIIIEKYLGRLLNKNECIHHINAIRNDNRLKNLYLFSSNGEHIRYHRLLRAGKIKKITYSNL